MAFNLDDYEPVSDRIDKFWKDHPLGSITTEIVHFDEKHFIVKASVWRLKRSDDTEWTTPDTTGYAEEIIGSTNVNRTSALENCETSAIGRALANLGYAVKNRASREEMAKAQPEPRQRSGGRRGPTPTPEPQERPNNGSQAHLTVEQVAKLAEIKTGLLASVNSDRQEARRLWEGTLETFSLAPGDPIPADMIGPIEHSIKALAIKGDDE